MKRQYVVISILFIIVITIVIINVYISFSMTHEEAKYHQEGKPVLRRLNALTKEDIARIEKLLNKKLRKEKQSNDE